MPRGRRAAASRRPKAKRSARRTASRRAKAPRRSAKRPPTTRRRPKAAASAPKRALPATPPAPRRRAPRTEATHPLLERQRRRLSEEERLEQQSGVMADERLTAEARSGRRGLKAALARHSEADPSLTGGDIDARWDDAYAVGDEAPGGDNPTPDQDRVDDIGKALGVTYQDVEELKGSEKITERDRHRWELDPASSDDWPHDRDKDE